MDDLRVYVLFNVQYFSYIRTMRVDNERLCAMEPRLRLRRFGIERGSNSGPLDQQVSAKHSELPGLRNSKRKQFAPSLLSRGDMTKSYILQVSNPCNLI